MWMAGKKVQMSRPWKIALFLAVLFVLGMGISMAWSAPQKTDELSKTPMFGAKDRQLIDAYYLQLAGTLAPGSVNRSPFPFEIEKVLAAGSHVPMQLEGQLELLPKKLESQLGLITGDYGRYTLGRHVLLVKKADLTIADILRNVR